MTPPSLPEFAELVGYPLRRWQAAALTLETRTTVIVAPRQVGKSYSLALLALWWAFTKPGQTVLIVSAGDDGAKRLLASIRRIAASPLLRGSTLDESMSLLVLSNGSTVRSVPSSERAIRGWSVDLLIIDEAAMVTDDILLGAAIPTTTARPDARIVLASTPWATDGAFYRMATAGDSEIQRVFQWVLTQADWIGAAAIEHARATLPPLRFLAEMEGQFVGRADAYFDPNDLLAAVAPYAALQPDAARGHPVVIGLDHGRAVDKHAIVAIGVLDDHDRNEQAVLYVPYAETSQRSYPDQMAVVVNMVQPRRSLSVQPRLYGDDISGVMRSSTINVYEDVRLLAPVGLMRPTTMPPLPPSNGFGVVEMVSEMNGVGYGVTEELQQRLRGHKVTGVHTGQRNKEEWFSRLRTWLGQRRMILPDDEELLRQLRGLSYEATQSGGLTISASSPAIHDDLAMAMALGASAVGPTAGTGTATKEPPGTEWLQTPGDRWVPANPRPRFGALRAGSGRMFTSSK